MWSFDNMDDHTQTGHDTQLPNLLLIKTPESVMIILIHIIYRRSRVMTFI